MGSFPIMMLCLCGRTRAFHVKADESDYDLACVILLALKYQGLLAFAEAILSYGVLQLTKD